MTCYAVIDTNVFVSALLSDKDNAATVQVVQKIINGDIIPILATTLHMNIKSFSTEKNSNSRRKILIFY